MRAKTLQRQMVLLSAAILASAAWAFIPHRPASRTGGALQIPSSSIMIPCKPSTRLTQVVLQQEQQRERAPYGE
eukprot:CAMPEP_0181110082 /NCGR_PEP_ID=MMETSP1071-20121207/18525_1 /TAXON_ID=35127 /ORGANISM="Thalassiosira sp., Strain NH16" /LENGTH=73 /DNA_ID=CAMNT_0023193831 /DNA_START=200 /DNA_END=418 /DNA_ORIENTATION=-